MMVAGWSINGITAQLRSSLLFHLLSLHLGQTFVSLPHRIPLFTFLTGYGRSQQIPSQQETTCQPSVHGTLTYEGDKLYVRLWVGGRYVLGRYWPMQLVSCHLWAATRCFWGRLQGLWSPMWVLYFICEGLGYLSSVWGLVLARASQKCWCSVDV